MNCFSGFEDSVNSIDIAGNVKYLRKLRLSEFSYAYYEGREIGLDISLFLPAVASN